MTPIDDIRIHFNPGQMALMNFCLAFIMFGVALHITPADFRRIAEYPRAFVVGLVAQWLLLPAMTVLLLLAWRPEPSVALGLMLIAACPGGNISNYVTHLGGGNVALSVTLTSTVTLLSIVVTPFAFFAFSMLIPGTRHLIKSIDLDPQAMLAVLFTILVLPLFAGMAVRRILPRLTARISRPVSTLSLVLFAGFILFALRANWHNMIDHADRVIALVIVHNLLALLLAYRWARAMRLNRYDARAVSMETGIQNAGLGLVLIFNFFPALGGMMLVAAAWAIWDLISAFLLALIWSRRPVNVPGRAI
jgi:BASS family bile acid:Na+ symporter